MQLRKIVVGLCLALFGCSSPKVPAISDGYTHHPQDMDAIAEEVPVWIDKDFTEGHKADIRNALGEWNLALNGYRTYRVVDDQFVLNAVVVEQVLNTSQGLIVLQRTEDNVPDDLPGSVLAWVLRRFPFAVNIVEDRIGTRDMHLIAMHEMGHTLGLDDLEIYGTLMAVAYPGQSGCIDELAIRGVHGQNPNWRMEHMNWCTR